MNFFGKKTSHFGEDNGFYDVPLESTGTVEPVAEEETETAPAMEGLGSVGLGGGSLALKVFCPTKFEEVSVISDHLLANGTVVLNLENANPEVCRRSIDFLSGVAYSIRGKFRKIAKNTYIITPSNIEFSENAAANMGDGDRLS
ncbi:MAG: cell division protein SepF [Clostridia bacterium]|nr:cell division protein SepF [Clostridia bacterium]